MGKHSDEIAMRDPAMAALMGLIDDDFGSDGDAFEPDQFEGEDSFAGSFGGEDDEDEMGLESIFGVAAPPPPGGSAALANVHPAIRKIVHNHMRKHAHRDQRLMLLEPNKYSELKVERYTFSVSANISTLGTTQNLGPASNAPDVNFRPQRVTSNAVSPGFVFITDGRVANVSFTVGGLIDAWQWNANAVGQSLDVPTLTPANKATFSATYNGLVPTPLSGTGAYTFILSFSGPASIVA
jgi:hypothetical protein